MKSEIWLAFLDTVRTERFEHVTEIGQDGGPTQRMT
jgi:hypothetical protein